MVETFLFTPYNDGTCDEQNRRKVRSSTGGSGAYWSAETSSVKSYYLFFRSKLSSSGSINNELDMNRSYGYTVRCCKE